MKNFLLALGLSLSLVLTVSAYNDVSEGDPYFEAIEWASDNQVVAGYPDGTFRSENKINRAEFLKIIYEARGQEMIEEGESFSDVSEGDWFQKYVETAFSMKTIEGYEDGTFRPGDPINFVGAAKILSLYNAFELPNLHLAEAEWFQKYVMALENEGLILPSIQGFEHELTRGELVEMMYRYKNFLHKESLSFVDLYLESQNKKVKNLSLPGLSSELINFEKLFRWGEAGRLDFDFEEYPLPWSILSYQLPEDPALIVDANGESLDELLGINDIARMKGSFMNYTDNSIEDYVSGADALVWSDLKLKYRNDWLTIPYGDRYVGALNLQNGDFKLEQMPDFYSQVTYDGHGYVYVERNQLGCALNAELAVDRDVVFEGNPKCRVWAYDAEKDAKVAMSYVMNYIDGLFSKRIFDMDEDYVWVSDTVWECYMFCVPSVTKYDRKTGQKLGRIYGELGYENGENHFYVKVVDKDQNTYTAEYVPEDQEADYVTAEEAWSKVIEDYPEFVEVGPANYPFKMKSGAMYGPDETEECANFGDDKYFWCVK